VYVDGAGNVAWGAGEAGEEPVPGRVQLTSAKTDELSADERVVLFEQLAPTPVSELGCLRCRSDDVREEDGRKRAVGLALLPASRLPDLGDEVLDFCRDRFATPNREVADPRHLDKPGGGDVRGDVDAGFDRNASALRPVRQR